MHALLTHADDVLRAASRPQITASQFSLKRTLAIIIVCGMFYGAVMGTFGGLANGRGMQIVYSALKVPLMMGVTFAVSVPSFRMINTLLGFRDDFEYSLHALAATQAGISITLASLAPFTLLFYASTSHHESAILFNAFIFACATLSGQRLLKAHYSALIERDERHRKVLKGWLAVFAIVAIQMAWLLRPFVGDPDAPVAFLRSDGWTNAYESLARIVWRVLTK